MPAQFITRARAHEDGGGVALARITGAEGTSITQSTVSAIDFSVHKKVSGAQVLAAAPLTVSEVVFNALQTADPRWTVDATGYNFKHIVPATAFLNGGLTYVVEYQFTPTDTDYPPFWHVFEVEAIKIART